MTWRSAWLSGVLLVSAAACGDDESGDDGAGSDGASCEPGAIVGCACQDGSPGEQVCMTDGAGFWPCECEGEMGGASASASSSPGTGSASGSGSAEGPSTMTSAATSDSGSACEGSHPLVEGDARFCGDGDCYCRPTDTCFAEAEAAGCCEDVVLCGGLACMGSHPLVEGDMRFCEPGACYCGDPQADPPLDVCYAVDRADACCPVDVVCD